MVVKMEREREVKDMTSIFSFGDARQFVEACHLKHTQTPLGLCCDCDCPGFCVYMRMPRTSHRLTFIVQLVPLDCHIRRYITAVLVLLVDYLYI